MVAYKSDHAKLSIPYIRIGNENINLSTEAKNIGFVFDSLMDCKSQISQMYKSGWFHLRKLGRIRSYIDKASAET